MLGNLHTPNRDHYVALLHPQGWLLVVPPLLDQRGICVKDLNRVPSELKTD